MSRRHRYSSKTRVCQTQARGRSRGTTSHTKKRERRSGVTRAKAKFRLPHLILRRRTSSHHGANGRAKARSKMCHPRKVRATTYRPLAHNPGATSGTKSSTNSQPRTPRSKEPQPASPPTQPQSTLPMKPCLKHPSKKLLLRCQRNALCSLVDSNFTSHLFYRTSPICFRTFHCGEVLLEPYHRTFLLPVGTKRLLYDARKSQKRCILF